MQTSEYVSPWLPSLISQDVVGRLVKADTARRRLRKGEFLYQQGFLAENFYLLLEGRLELSSITENAKKIIMSISEPYCFVGQTSSKGRRHHKTAMCLSNTCVAVFPMSDILRYSQENAELYYFMLLEMIDKDLSQFSLLTQKTSTVEEQVLLLMNLFGETFGVKRDRDVYVEMPFTHQTIAEIIGSSRTRVSQAFSRLAGDKKLSKHKKNLIIHN
jgi:CRP/FNR family transcriptional regulator